MNNSEFEQNIITLILQKKEEGLTLLQQHFGPLLRYVIRPILPREEDQEECLSDILVKVWEKTDTYDPGSGSLKGWLTAIARNSALDKARRLAHSPETAGQEEMPEDLPSQEDGPEESVLRQERETAVRRAVEALPQSEKILIYRYFYYRQPLGQIAAETGSTARAVEGKLYRIRQKLRKELEKLR